MGFEARWNNLYRGLAGNPTLFQAVLDRLRSKAGMKLTHSLRFVVSGTTYLPPTLRAELEETLGVPVLQSYGMSEAGILAAPVRG